MLIEHSASADNVAAGMVACPAISDDVFAPVAIFHVECVGPDGEVKWTEEVRNLVTSAGKTDILDKYLKGSAYTAAWYCLLKDGGAAPAAADTLASHGAWAEVTAYSNANRPTITWGTTSGGSNTCTAVSFSINANATVAGAGTVTNATKGGTTGTLYNLADFSASRTVASGDTLNVTITLTIS